MGKLSGDSKARSCRSAMNHGTVRADEYSQLLMAWEREAEGLGFGSVGGLVG